MLSDDPRRLVVYLRVSTIAQKSNTSLRGQLRRIREYAQSHGYKLVAIHRDVESGRKLARKGFDAANKMVLSGEADGIIVWSLDRYIRSALNGWSIIAQLEAAGKHLVVVNRSMDTMVGGPSGRLVFHILLAVAEHEASVIAERMGAGREEKKAEGGHYAGQCRFGWRAIDKKLEPIPSQQWTLKVINKFAGLGVSSYKTAIYLNRKKEIHATKKGGDWTHKSIERIKSATQENGYTTNVSTIDEGRRVQESSRLSSCG